MSCLRSGLVLLAPVLSLLLAASSGPAGIPPGFTSLFNGRNLAGWPELDDSLLVAAGQDLGRGGKARGIDRTVVRVEDVERHVRPANDEFGLVAPDLLHLPALVGMALGTGGGRGRRDAGRGHGNNSPSTHAILLPRRAPPPSQPR